MVDLNEIEARVKALGAWHPSVLRDGSDHYEPAEPGEKQGLWWECPTCGGDGEIEGQRYDASNVLPATLIAGGIGDGLRVAEWWAEESPAVVLALVAEVKRLRLALEQIEPAIKAHSVLAHVNCSHCAEAIHISRSALMETP